MHKPQTRRISQCASEFSVCLFNNLFKSKSLSETNLLGSMRVRGDKLGFYI